MKQNLWTVKYRSCWPTFIIRSKVVPHWCDIPNEVHQWLCLQYIGQNQWTLKYRLLWPTTIMRTKFASNWVIISKYDVQPNKQDMKQNYWTYSLKDLHLLWGQLLHHTDSTIKHSSRYKAELLDCKRMVTVTYIYYEINVCSTMIHYIKVWCSSITIPNKI